MVTAHSFSMFRFHSQVRDAGNTPYEDIGVWDRADEMTSRAKVHCDLHPQTNTITPSQTILNTTSNTILALCLIYVGICYSLNVVCFSPAQLREEGRTYILNGPTSPLFRLERIMKCKLTAHDVEPSKQK